MMTLLAALLELFFREIPRPIELFAFLFYIDKETVLEAMQMDIIELQCNYELKNKCADSSVHQFYKKKHLSVIKYPNLSGHIKRTMVLFVSTYVCERLFSTMNLQVKYKFRSSLTDEQLESTLRLVTTAVQLHIDQLIQQMLSKLFH